MRKSDNNLITPRKSKFGFNCDGIPTSNGDRSLITEFASNGTPPEIVREINV